MRRLARCLAIGAAINIGIAWSVPALVPASWFNGQYGVGGQGWPTDVPADWPEADYWSSMAAIGYTSRSASSNLSELARTRRQDPSVVVHYATLHRYGLPFRSLTARRFQVQTGRTIQTLDEEAFLSGIPIGLLHYEAPYRRIALRPSWLGFALNTLLYGLLVLFVTLGFRRVRAGRRRRRGVCIGCGYDLAGLVDCPECGTETQQDAGSEA